MGTKEETVLMIKGKLAEDGLEPQNVQVSIVTREGMPGALDMELIGEDGPFLRVGLQRTATGTVLKGVLDPAIPKEGDHECDDTSSELQLVCEENAVLKQRILELQVQLDKMTDRTKSLWKAKDSDSPG